ncbi:MAG: chemotaxis protein CheW [Gammaproteobacteria bacterium]|nr:chemotaxis protein CheW [Gammaproteobacteria bacterium]
MSKHQKNSPLINEHQALGAYLEALLEEVPDTFPETDVVEHSVITAREILTPPVIAPPMELPVVEKKTVVVTPVEEVVEVVQETHAPTKSDRPDYANEPFEALLFKVSGVKLAVPLKELNGILEWPETITEMPGHAPWFLGIVKNLETSVNLIDTALIVVPEKLRQAFPIEAGQRCQRIVLIGDGKWGLACDAVEEVITLEPTSVRWRTSRTKRRWLAGTVIEHMSALIDPEEFAALLTSDEVGIAS